MRRTTTNDTSGMPPRLASARATGKSWRAAPTCPHAKPPSGQRTRSPSSATHAAAVIHGDRTPRRPSVPTIAPAPAQYAAWAAMSGTIATAPKYTLHHSSTAKNATPAAKP